jgi:hypothetical protein
VLGESSLVQQQQQQQRRRRRREQKGQFKRPLGVGLAGIGISQIKNGIFTFIAKAWAWKKIIIVQLAFIVLLTISSIVLLNPSSVDEETAAALLSVILIRIIVGILALGYSFAPRVRSYFGNTNFSSRCLIYTDVEGV